MRNTLTCSYLLDEVKAGNNPNAVIYEGDLETYVWDGEEYVGVNNERPLIEILAANHTMKEIAKDRLLDIRK